MEADLLLLLALAVLATSFISGIFGMAGGLLLMMGLLFFMPVPQAMITHGLAQMASNGWRAVLHFRAIIWPLIGRYCLGALAALLLFSFFRYVPEKAHVFLFIGGTTLVALFLPPSLALDATRRGHSELCGFLVNALHFTAGVSGILLQAFYVNTPLNRHQSIATRGQTQAIAHLIKIFYFALIATAIVETEQPVVLGWEAYALVIMLAFIGALAGKYVLDRMAEQSFQRISRVLVLVLALFSLARGLVLLGE